MRRPRSRGSRILLLASVLGVCIGAGARASGEDYAPPRHTASRPLALAAAPLSALAADPLCDTGVAGVVVLDRDVSCVELFVRPGATLDLGGFTFEGAISAGAGATLRNGTIVGGPLELGADCLLEDLEVRDGDEFVVQPHGPRSVIRRSRFTGNDVAIDIYYGDRPGEVTVADCEFEDNGYGVNIAKGSANLVTSNVFRNNGVGVNLWNEDAEADGVRANDNTISGNLFQGNRRGAVIETPICDGAAPDCFEGNAFVDNAVLESLMVGLALRGFDDPYCDSPYYSCDVADLRIEHNHFEANGFGPGVVGGDGLSVSAPPEVADGVVVARNTAVANADLGIEAPGVVDGGGNRARENGNALQCLGVLCELLVDIDVLSWDPKRLLHPHGHRPIAVVLYGSQSFDVGDVDVRSLAFGPAGAGADPHEKRKLRDENDDGFPDLVVRFRNHEAGIAFGDREACLSGETRDGVRFGGCAAISTEGACGQGFELALLLPPLVGLRRARALRSGSTRGAPRRDAT